MNLLLLTTLMLAEVASGQERIELLFGPEEEYRSALMRSNDRKLAVKEGLKRGLDEVARKLGLKQGGQNLGNANNLFYDFKLDEKELNIFMGKLQNYCGKWSDLSCNLSVSDAYANIRYDTGEILDGEKVMSYFTFKYDHGVMELNSAPFKLKDLDSRHGEVYSRILGALKKEGWKTAKIGGEGHLHFDIDSAFRLSDGTYDVRRYRNFFVDWINHNELNWGILHYDPKIDGAAPIVRTSKENEAFRATVAKIDEFIAEHGPIVSRELFHQQSRKINWGLSKGDSIAIRDGTIEIRSLRPKENLEEMKRVCRLLESRLNHVAKVDRLLPYYGGIAPAGVQEAIDRFYLYVTEAGESWSEMKKLMPVPWRTLSPNRDIPQERLYSSGKFKPSTLYQCQAWLFNHLLKF